VVLQQQAEQTSSATRRPWSVALWLYIGIAVVYHRSWEGVFANPAVQNWATILVSLTLQAAPFLVLGVLVSAAVSTLVPSSWIERALPRSDWLAVPAAGVAGAVLPGCECSAAPVAGRMVSRGVRPAVAFTFLLAAPAINPVVLVSTAVAFPGQPQMVVARGVASFVAAVSVGFIWRRVTRNDDRLRRRLFYEHRHDEGFTAVATHEFVQAGGFLVIGAALVATLQTAVPAETVTSLGGHGLLAILAMAGLAVVLSICSEADAFVASGLTGFPLSARLVFLVVGPMVDLKLIALQTGVFGRRFSSVFAPLTFATALSVSAVIGALVL
jgi:uncharacterized membrane protein YraQ (UPF0718 family)